MQAVAVGSGAFRKLKVLQFMIPQVGTGTYVVRGARGAWRVCGVARVRCGVVEVCFAWLALNGLIRCEYCAFAWVAYLVASCIRVAVQKVSRSVDVWH